jgi:hypothetical protein
MFCAQAIRFTGEAELFSRLYRRAQHFCPINHLSINTGTGFPETKRPERDSGHSRQLSAMNQVGQFQLTCEPVLQVS